MIYVGIDDTDMPGTPGTNQLARAVASELADEWLCNLITRHQLLRDPRVPFTSKNSSASLLFSARHTGTVQSLTSRLREFLRRRAVEGSDAGLCVALQIPQELTTYGRRCQRELVVRQEAHTLANRLNVHLEGLGGTNDGVIGALAAVGLIRGGSDGRVVQIGNWPDDLSGDQDIKALRARGVQVRCLDSDDLVDRGLIDVGKHLRPNYREGRIVLFVEPSGDQGEPRWRAVRLT